MNVMNATTVLAVEGNRHGAHMVHKQQVVILPVHVMLVLGKKNPDDVNFATAEKIDKPGLQDIPGNILSKDIAIGDEQIVGTKKTIMSK